ncbi:hypothetical protein [Cellulosimicrobium marinum]|uniref:hypothetical protein n=1 Tax=Cellulosimicrobium marinum TaxID=1638992 RepID=UPI001E3BADA6|nr:hypothetical protein [Cellulosimicrobium marinum]MCB7135142.1 hypothetical protein [Cellulosimicrobium marinum]
MLPTLPAAFSVPVLLGELLGWVLGVVALVPGRVGVVAVEVRETVTAWGIPVAELSDLYAGFPARLAVAVLVVAVVSATAAIVHGLRERRRAARPRR